MKLETGWNHCTFKAESEEEYKLLLLLYSNLKENDDVLFNIAEQELSIHTYT